VHDHDVIISLQEWLVNEKKLDVFGMKLPTGFQLIGQVVRNVPHFLLQVVAPPPALPSNPEMEV